MAGISLMALFLTVVVWLVSSLPLYFALKLVGKKKGLVTVALVNVAAAMASSIIASFFGFFTGALIGFITLLFVYKWLFKIGWARAFLAWLLQIAIAALLFVFMIVFLGITLFAALI